MSSAVKAEVERTIVFYCRGLYCSAVDTSGYALTYPRELGIYRNRLTDAKAQGITLWLTFLLWSLGVSCCFGKRLPWLWFEAAEINVTIVTLFLFAPLFGIPVRLPEYVEA